MKTTPRKPKARIIYTHPEMPDRPFDSGWMGRSKIAEFWVWLQKHIGVTEGRTELR